MSVMFVWFVIEIGFLYLWRPFILDVKKMDVKSGVNFETLEIRWIVQISHQQILSYFLVKKPSLLKGTSIYYSWIKCYFVVTWCRKKVTRSTLQQKMNVQNIKYTNFIYRLYFDKISLNFLILGGIVIHVTVNVVNQDIVYNRLIITQLVSRGWL